MTIVEGNLLSICDNSKTGKVIVITYGIQSWNGLIIGQFQLTTSTNAVDIIFIWDINSHFKFYILINKYKKI